MNQSIYEKNRQELRGLMDKINCPDIKQLSNLSRIPERQLYRLQCGLMPRLPLETLAKLGETLGVPVGDLMIKFIDYTGKKEHLTLELARLQAFENLQERLDKTNLELNVLGLEYEGKQRELRDEIQEKEVLIENLREEYNQKYRERELERYELDQQLLDSQRALNNLREYSELKEREADLAITNLREQQGRSEERSRREREELTLRLGESQSALDDLQAELKRKIEESEAASDELRREYEERERQLREREGELTLKLEAGEEEIERLRREYEELSTAGNSREMAVMREMEERGAGLNRKIEETDSALTALREEYRSLQERYERQRQELTGEFQAASLEVLESWLLQWPTAEAVARRNPQLSAVKLLTLVKPVMELVKRWGVEQIHQVGERVDYDPRLHQLIEGDADEPSTVVVRYVGYRQGDNILYRGKVSPAKATADAPAPPEVMVTG